MLARVRLPVLMAAAMAVHVAVGADVDQHVEAILAAAEAAQQIVAAAAGLDGYVEHFQLCGPGSTPRTVS